MVEDQEEHTVLLEVVLEAEEDLEGLDSEEALESAVVLDLVEAPDALEDPEHLPGLLDHKSPSFPTKTKTMATAATNSGSCSL